MATSVATLDMHKIVERIVKAAIQLPKCNLIKFMRDYGL